jgi:hypothetical protein
MGEISLSDTHLHHQLLDIENDFLTCVSDGTERDFISRWTSIQTALSQSQTLKPETKTLAVSVSRTMSLLCNSMLDLDQTAKTLSLRLAADTDRILGLSLPSGDDSRSHKQGSTSSSQSSSSYHSQYPCPTYIASAYKWLRHNLHKPYPTVEEIKSICANSNTSEKRIRNWFISARQRMGWTRIAKEHFHSDREDTADAAYRALVETDPKRPIDAKLMFEFVKMELAAEKMYSTAFQPSQFAGGLGTTIVGMSAEHKARIVQMRQQAIEEENLREEIEYKMKRQRILQRRSSQRRSVSLYPSPDRSSESSPAPTLVLSETEEDETDVSLLNTAAGCERGRSSSSSDQLDSHVDKRLRFVVCPYRCTFNLVLTAFHRSATTMSLPNPSTSLPSPPAIAEKNVLDYWASPEASLTDPKPLSTCPLPTSCRKRRLSDADAQEPLKRPRGLAVGSRLQAASDPLPMTSTVVQAPEFQNWNMTNFDFNFDLPSIATSQPLDPSIPIDVEFFNNWTNDVALATILPSSTTICKLIVIEPSLLINILSSAPSSNAQVDLSTSVLHLGTTPVFDLSSPAGTEFDQFMHDLGMLSQPSQNNVAEVSLNLPAPTPQATSVLRQAPELVGDASDDWSIYLESAPPVHRSTAVVVSPKPDGFIDFSTIPNFDPSTSKPSSPPSPADIIAQSESAAKRAKLEQWRAHLEAAMKLQQELEIT